MKDYTNKLFDFNGHQVTVIMSESKEPFFIASEVCKLIELRNTTHAISRLDDDEKLTSFITRSGQKRKVNIINESGLYSLILSSKKKEAKAFKKWVTSKVLPSIRKHGTYAKDELLNDPDLFIKALQNLKKEREENNILKIENSLKDNKIKILQPRAELADRITATKELIDIGQSAKILGLPFGRNIMFRHLREMGILFRNRNEPKQEYVSRGYFVLKEQLIERKNSSSFVVMKILVTQKGLSYLSRIFETGSNNNKIAKIT